MEKEIYTKNGFEYLTKCNWCDWKGYIHPDINECPNCYREGYLMDIEEEGANL